MFQFNIVFGILVAFFSNFMLAGLGENSWRWMLGIVAVPYIGRLYFSRIYSELLITAGNISLIEFDPLAYKE